MAQKESVIITVFLALFLAFAAVAVSKGEKFPPISGEIYGQAVPGLKSLYVNGKKVPFDEDYNFKTTINLKAGQKYLTLVLNYEGIRIIKKYLVLRKAETKKFKIVVPKEKIEKEVAAARRPPTKEILRRKKILALIRAQKRKQEEKLRKIKMEERKKLAEKRWIEMTASPRFSQSEFLLGPSPEVLVQAIEQDNYGITFKKEAKSLEKLNYLLQIPNFYDLVVLKGKKVTPNQTLKKLITETKNLRSKPFALLSTYQKNKIMVLNRMLLEALYFQTPKKKTWLVKETKLPVVPKICEYLYVWEFSEGKLLLVKERKGSYAAEIYIPVAKEWLDLKGISVQELKEIIGKPITTFQSTKKK